VGQQGLIPPHLCDPIQYFGHEPCGCGEFNPAQRFIDKSALSTAPADQQQQQATTTATATPASTHSPQQFASDADSIAATTKNGGDDVNMMATLYNMDSYNQTEIQKLSDLLRNGTRRVQQEEAASADTPPREDNKKKEVGVER
jgi:hypothetical protein